ncbi:S-layer homology domain-containing protein [Ureibacillus chungkukjangi]|uniref:S-layer homology domain-containing protein n=1 Tax=Ureibacillus chungkukjangi TaxID=1202712 RepID=UPI00384C9098
MVNNRSLALKAVTVLLVTILFLGTTLHTKAGSIPFTDVDKLNTHYESIVYLYNEGIIYGKSSTKYQPFSHATRGETALFIANALELDTKNVKNPNFKDVPITSKYYGAIAALVQIGVVKGYSDRTFKPENPLTRSQMAKMLTLGFELSKSISLKTNFNDVKKMPDSESRLYIQTLIDYKITTGTTTNTFSPYANLLRGQLATFIYRTLQQSGDRLEVLNVE